MKTSNLLWSLPIISVLAGCLLFFQQPRIYADDSTLDSSEKTESFQVSDNMRCGISEFCKGIISVANILPFTKNQETLYYFIQKPIHFISTAKYTGQTREIPERRIKTLLTHGEMKGWDARSFAEHYVYEMLFLENNQEYWIPVQKQNILDFSKYGIKPGDDIALRIIYIGLESFKDGSVEFGFFVHAFSERDI